jgi:hypothetical protein
MSLDSTGEDAWLPWRYVEKPEPGVISRTILRCHRCKQKAFDDMDDRGYTDRAIDYEEGYLAPRGFGRLTREDRAVLRLVTDADIRNNLGAQRGK